MSITKRGDTIIEVVFAFGVFAAVSVAAIGIMNSGLNQAQRSLEGTMARNEMNAQAEAIRFIHNNFSLERVLPEDGQQFSDIWKKMVKYTFDKDHIPMSVNSFGKDKSCDDVYKEQAANTDNDIRKKFFVLNPRNLKHKNSTTYDINTIIIKNSGVSHILKAPSLYPRIIYSATDDENLRESDSNLHFHEAASSIEGVWDFVVKGPKIDIVTGSRPQYYDFYVRTCWQPSGSKSKASISTIIRLYNPEAFE